MKLGILCCKSAPIIGFLRLVRSGYSPGEVIHIQADVENNSGSTIRNITFTLFEVLSDYITSHIAYVQRDLRLYLYTYGTNQSKSFRNKTMVII